MKRTVLFTLLVSLFIFVGSTISGAGAGEDGKWILKKSTGNVSLYYKIGECNGSDVIFLKFDNKNNYNVRITWKESITDKANGAQIDNYKGQKELVLVPGVTQQDGCAGLNVEECVIRMTEVTPVRVVDPQELEFKDVKVSKVSNN